LSVCLLVVQAGEFETKVEGDGPIGKSFNEIDPIKDDSSEDYVDDWNCVPFPAEPDWELYRNMRMLWGDNSKCEALK